MVFGPTGILVYWYIGIGILVYITAKKIDLPNYPIAIANFH